MSKSWPIELDEDALPEVEDPVPELEPYASLSWLRALAPCELGESEASCDMALPTTESSPTYRPNSIVWSTSALSAELAAVLAPVALAAEDAAFKLVESSCSKSCCAEVESPFPRSEPS